MAYKFGFAEHERLAIEAFIAAPKRARCLEQVSNVRTRKKFLAELDAGLEFDRVRSHAVPSARQDAAALRARLESKGAPIGCWAISADSDMDGRELDLLEALQLSAVNECGTILSCVPGKLAYYSSADKTVSLLLF